MRLCKTFRATTFSTQKEALVGKNSWMTWQRFSYIYLTFQLVMLHTSMSAHAQLISKRLITKYCTNRAKLNLQTFLYTIHTFTVTIAIAMPQYALPIFHSTTSKWAQPISETPPSSPNWLTHNPSFPWYVHHVPVWHHYILHNYRLYSVNYRLYLQAIFCHKWNLKVNIWQTTWNCIT